MTTKRVAVLAVIAVLILMIFVFLRGPGAVPAGQAPLLALSSANLGDFQKAFDAHADVPRLLLLVSPT